MSAHSCLDLQALLEMNTIRSQSHPVWRSPRCVLRSNFPEEIRACLLDPTSLTRRLQELCAGEFRVRVLKQGWARPSHEEARVLGLRAGAYANVREVHLLCHEHPSVFARTVIPPRTLKGRYRRLTRLGSRSLGAVLFSDKTMRRGGMEVARITAGHCLFERAVSHLRKRPAVIWGRRSLFHLAGKPLLLSEIFLASDLFSGPCGAGNARR